MTVWHERDITYMTDSPAKLYTKSIGEAATVRALRARLRHWSRLAPDAVAQASKIRQKDWSFARKHRRNDAAAQEVVQIAGAILMPEVLLQVEMIARHFTAPWGCAFIRAREEGLLVERNGGWYVAKGHGTGTE